MIDKRDFELIPIVLETLTFRFNHNKRFVGGRMVSGPPNVMCHIGEGGEMQNERGFLEMIQELGRFGWSYSVNATTEERNLFDVVEHAERIFHEEPKYPSFDVRSW